MVPLSPFWVIGEGAKTIAVLEFNEPARRFDIHIRSGVSAQGMDAAKKAGTVKSNSLHCPACKKSTPFNMLRGDRRSCEEPRYGLRLWEPDDLVPLPEDVFQERLYCIRWVKTYIEDDKVKTCRHYCAPDVLGDVWIQMARGEIEAARQTIDALPRQHPFEIKYHLKIEKVDWESCARVLMLVSGKDIC